MDIAPVILSLHPELDARQREVVGHVDGPHPGIAGPGAGKTQSIQLRAINLLLTGEAAAGELLLCTFGSDAARGLQQRSQKSALACGIRGALSEVRIGTIHSLCHRLLAPHVGLAGLRLDYRVLDEHEQHMLLHQEFDAIFGPDWDIPSGRGWRDGVHTVAEAGRYFDRICDEMIVIEVLTGSERPFIAALGRCLRRYREMLLATNAADFAHLQVWAERVIRDGDIAARAGGAERHLMVDEFQDTSYIQMRILHRLAGAHGNITQELEEELRRRRKQ